MSHRHSFSIVGDLVVTVFCVALLALTVILLVLCKRRRAANSNKSNVVSTSLHAHSIPFSDVDAATAGFNQSLIIGEGLLGTVYKATSSTGDALAVKRISPQLVLANPGLGFASRAKSLSFIRHPNLVPVLGYAEAPGERIIITELVGSRSLEFYLQRGSPALLDWGLRLRIAAGAARGVEHLHEGAVPGVVHGRIKPTNILIDAGFTARVCDYGLTFLAPSDRRGMLGYLDGECLRERGGMCKASDVYGFGVVLLELLSGRRSEEGRLVDWALPLIRGSMVGEVMDPRLRLPNDVSPFIRLAKVASACVGNCRSSRPSINQVAAILSSLEMKPFL